MLKFDEEGVGSDSETYWQIWRGAVAVDAICVRRGLSGVSVGLGKFRVAVVDFRFRIRKLT